jgi:predicted nuclease of predicted toxin-antitoxin system
MKIKLDENLPLRLATRLKALGHDVHTLYDERLIGRTDNEIWETTQKESRFLITQDLDFSDTRRFSPGSHHGILLLRLRAPNRRNLIERVEELFQEEQVSEWARCFVVATGQKIRVRKPENKRTS